jgi:multiple sugar transport system substrate-binding protein
VDNLTRFYKIPGNEVDEKTITGAPQNTFFFKDRVAAMFATVGSPSIFASNPAVNMDVATIPAYPDLPGISGKPSATVFGVSALSKHKEEAFKVLMYLTSKEYQLDKAKRGVISVLSSDPDIRKAFGTEEASLKGKNIQALNPAKFASPGKASNYDQLALPSVLKYMNLVAQGNMDVNTALRSAAEETDKAIEALRAKQGK